MDSDLIGPTGKPRMLIVDDEEGLRLAIRAVFHTQFDLYLCKNSREAMKAIAEHRISIAILDIKMVGESGLDLLRKIKEADPLVEVIMLTAYETLDAVKTAVRNQACDFLTKPFDLGVISESVARALRLRMASEVAQTAIEKMNGSASQTITLQDGILHDVRNVMTIVLGMAECCSYTINERDVLSRQDILELRQNFDVVLKNTTLASALCNRYLNALRKLGSPNPSHDIHPVLSDLCQLLRSHPEAKGSEISFIAVPGIELRVAAEPVEVFQLVFNVALNGLQAADRRQHLTVEARIANEPLNPNMLNDTASIRVVRGPSFSNKPPYVALTIRDSGDGIAPAVLERLFTPFLTTKATGTGVGMAVVAKLVEKNDGLLFLESTLGKGTTTTIYLPTPRN
jgi:signal transduction histidine kinase